MPNADRDPDGFRDLAGGLRVRGLAEGGAVNHRLPYFWRRMSWTQKAAWLCSAHIARSYEEACAMLAKLPRKRKGRPVEPRLPYADN
jgi:hypothetical protein